MPSSKRPSPETRRKSSTLHYMTFPTKPPVSRGRPPSDSEGNPGSPSRNGSESEDAHNESPLPKKQLAVLAVVALAEQTALNSISPYLPDMTSTFPEVKQGQIGLYVGLIASSFALAQFLTNFFWGWLSDRIGRKPVICIGTLFTAASFVAFGFCRTLWQAMLVQAFMGIVNGNQGVVSTCLGEITDRSNQSRAFTYLPVVYGIGAITGPALGGLLVMNVNPITHKPNPYPYLFPNLFSAAILILDLVIVTIFMEESLEEARNLPPIGKRIENLFTWLWQFTSSTRPTYLRRLLLKKKRQARRRRRSESDGSDGYDDEQDDEDSDGVEEAPELFPGVSATGLKAKQVFHRDTILLMITYFIFQLSNISFNSLYPIFGQAPAPVGRELSPKVIGLSLSFAGVFTILFQVGVYGKLREKIGNKVTYRFSFLIFVFAFLLTPFVGYKDGKGVFQGKSWLYSELAVVLVLRTVASVGGLTSALLLVCTNHFQQPCSLMYDWEKTKRLTHPFT